MKILFDSRDYYGETADDWEFEEEHFNSMIRGLITSYEKRYKTTVKYIAVAGKIQLWDGNRYGGAIVGKQQSVLSPFQNGNYDVSAIVDKYTNDIIIQGHHHDGTHEMKIEFLTPNKIKTQFPILHSTGTLDGDEAEKLASIHRTKVKFNKFCEGYYGTIENKGDNKNDANN